jgi:cation diffusion facilitator family transporter
LAAVKFGVGLFTGSLTVMASAADSLSDAMMSSANAWGYRMARDPADAEHPYGHGKFEGAMAVGQGMLLVGIACGLLAASVRDLVQGPDLRELTVAVWTLVASGGISGALALMLRRAAKTSSVIVAADAAHYTVDLLAAAAGVAGLLVVEATGLRWLDAAVCAAAALLMVRASASVLRRGAAELLDEALPPEELALVEGVLEANAQRVVEVHGLRTRRSGPLRFVEVHVVLRPEQTFAEVHAVVQDIGDEIRSALPGSRVLVHPDALGMEDRVDHGLEQPSG